MQARSSLPWTITDTRASTTTQSAFARGGAATQAMTCLQEATTEVSRALQAESPQEVGVTLAGYLWLNVQLTEQLTHLRRLLGLILTPPHRKQPD